MNRYLQQLNGSQSLFGTDIPEEQDDLEVELITGSIDDLHDEAEILSVQPKVHQKKVRRVQKNIKKQLTTMLRRAKRIKCPYRRKLIQKRIRELKKHGSLNRQYSNFEKVAISSLVGASGVAATALAYQHYLTRDIASQQQALPSQTVGFLNDNADGGPFYARPKLTHLFQEYKGFYLAEFLVLTGIYSKFILPKGK